MPTAYILIGVPAAGKSTWLEKQGVSPTAGIARDGRVRLSSDFYIDEIAAERGMTYSEVFSDVVGWAHERLDEDLTFAVERGDDIYWDQTNTTVKGRAKNLKRIPKNYRKVAVFFPTPENSEWKRRLAQRPGKVIPQHVLNSMRDNLTKPTKDEGFDEIVTVGV